MIGTALAVASMVGGLVNNVIAGNSARKARERLDARKAELDLEYKYEYNQDFLNTPMAKSAISLLSQKYIENARKVAQGSVISGASDERRVASAEAMQKPFIGAITNLAGYGQQRQDSLRSQHLGMEQNLFGLQYGADMQQSQNQMNAAGNAFNAASAFGSADANGAFAGKADDWMKNLFKSGVAPDQAGFAESTGSAARKYMQLHPFSSEK